MILTFAEDFTSTTSLDTQLTDTPESGLYWNRGVHPLVTLDNIFSIIPSKSFTFTAWSSIITYSKFDTSRKRSDVVSYNSKIYLSLLGTNLNKVPGVSTTYWLETTIDSLRLRAFIWGVEDNYRSALKLDRKLIENQYIYNVGKTSVSLSNDYSGWAFEPKGSDYIKIRINQMSLQAVTTNPVTVTVVNQETVITTITLNPNNGLLEFEDVGYTISGKGRFLFVFPSQTVLSENAFNDPLRYDGFVCYPVNGIGASPQDAEYSESSIGNGLNFNVSAYLDSDVYLTNNKIDFAKFIQTQFEYDFLRMAYYNANAQSSLEERNITSNAMLPTEIMSLDMGTVARKYERIKKESIEAINRTFDKFLHSPSGFKVRRGVI
jgi:hypothetical protein